VAYSLGLLQWDAGIEQLPFRLQQYMVGETASSSREYNQQMRSPAPLPVSCDRIRVHKSGVLVASYDWQPEDRCLLQAIRATSAFHGKPYFDAVAVQVTESAVGDSEPRASVAYAKLLLLFEFSMPSQQQQQQQQRGREWRPLALVQWFEVPPVVRGRRQDPLERYGAIRLKVQQAAYPVGSQQQVPYCSIVDLEAILRREYIVPDFSEPGFYHVSPFKHVTCVHTVAIRHKSLQQQQPAGLAAAAAVQQCSALQQQAGLQQQCLQQQQPSCTRSCCSSSLPGLEQQCSSAVLCSSRRACSSSSSSSHRAQVLAAAAGYAVVPS
jgi:hypothetical protein